MMSMTTYICILPYYYIRTDSLVLHSPLSSFEETIFVWRIFENLFRAGSVRYIGISNFYDIDVLSRLYLESEIKPSVLQNRFYSSTGHDVEIREFCRVHNISYQSFWSLTANGMVLNRYHANITSP